MRYFGIQNERGEQFDLNGESGIWFSNVEGLGIADGSTYASLGHGFFRQITTEDLPMTSIPGDIVFMPPNAYEQYRKFVAFIIGSKDLRLMYRPYGTTTFYRKVKCEYIQKGVLERNKKLVCPTSFAPVTLWYSPKTMDLVMQEASETDMKFPFDFDADLTLGSSLIGSWAVEITASGDEAASVVFEYNGEAVSPVLTLIGSDSEKEYGRCAIDATVNGIRFSSQYLDSYIRDADGNDLTNDVSPGHDPFFRVPITEPCIFRLDDNGELTGSASVSINYFYRSV